MATKKRKMQGQQTAAPVTSQQKKVTGGTKLGTGNGQSVSAQPSAVRQSAQRVLNPDSYAQMLKDYLARGGQTVQLQPGKTAAQTAAQMVKAASPVQQTASQPSVQEQLIQRYYDTEAQATQDTRDAIEKAGGWANLTADDVQNMISRDVYRPTTDQSVLGYYWNGENQQATRDAYVNQQTDLEMARLMGTFDQPEYLLGGYSQYASDEYLKQLSARLPMLKLYENMRYGNALKEYEESGAPAEDEQAIMQKADELKRWNAGNQYLNTLMLETDESDGGAEYAQMWDGVTGRAQGDGEYNNAVKQLLELDNFINGTENTADYLNDMDDAARGDELKRLAVQYNELAVNGNAKYLTGEKPEDPYPYEAVQEIVNSELAGREAMAQYIEPMLNDPDFKGKSQPSLDVVDLNDALWKAGYYTFDEIKDLPEDMRVELAANLKNPDLTGMTYWVINGVLSPAQSGMVPGLEQLGGKGYDLMTPTEVAVYNYYFNTGDVETAQAYLSELETMLARRARAVEQAEWEFMATDNWFSRTMTDVATVAGNLINPLVVGAEIGSELVTGERSPVMNPVGDYVQTSRGAREEWIGENGLFKNVNLLGKTLGQQLYGAGMSTADMAAAIGAAYLTGGSSLAIMAAESAANAWDEQAYTERSLGERLFRAGLQGGTTYLTEKLPLDIITGKGGQKGFGRMIGGLLSEGAEEIEEQETKNLINWALAKAKGEDTPYEEKVLAYKLLGVENPELAARSEYALESVTAGFQGALVGGGMGAAGATVDAMGEAAVGRQVNKAGGVESLLKIGQAMQEGSESQKIASTLQLVAEKGKKVSSRKLGQLYSALVKETTEKYRGEVQQITVDAVAEQIEAALAEAEKPVETTYTAEQMAQAIVDAGGNLKKVKGNLGKFMAANSAVKTIAHQFEVGTGDWSSTLLENQLRKKAEEVSRLTDIAATATKPEEAKQSATAAETAAAGADAQTIEKDTQERVEAMTRRKSPKDKASKVVTFTDGGPETTGEFVHVEKTDGELSVVVEKDGEKKPIAIVDVKQVSAPIARVLAYAETRPEITATEINEMIAATEAHEGNVKTSQVIAAYEMGVAAGFTGQEAPALADVAEGMDASTDAGKALQSVLEMGYKAGSAESAAAETKRRGATGTGRAQYVGVSYMGEVENERSLKNTGVRETTDALKKTLNPAQFASVQALEKISEVSGINITLYRTKAEKGETLETPNGMFDPSTSTIYLDIDAGANEAGETMTESAILKTASHELTHYIEKHSGKGYAQLRDAMKEQIKAQGKDYYTLIGEKLRSNSHLKTRAQAEAEVIADAAEMMLKDSNAMQMMAQRSPGLWNTVKNWLKDFVRRIKRAFSGITATSEEAQALMDKAEKYLGDLQDLWDNALVEAVGAKQGEGATVTKAETADAQIAEAGNEVQYSPRAVSTTEKTSIKTQIRSVQEQINKMDSVANVTAPDISKWPMQKKKKWVMDIIGQTGYKVDVKGFGIVEIGENQIETSLTYLDEPGELAAFACVTRVIKRGLRIGGHENHKGRNYATTTFAAPVIINGTRGNMAVVVKHLGRNLYKTHRILLPDGSSFEFNEQQKTESGLMNGILPKTEAQAHDANSATKSVAQGSDYVKQYSERAEKTNTEAFKKWFGNSVVRNEDGSPKVMYHQTGADFTVFNTKSEGAGTRDNVTPFGIFLKESNRDIGLNGKKQMALYAKIENPLSVQNREELVRMLEKLSQEYASIRRKAQEIDVEYSAKVKAAQAAFTDYLVQLRNAEKESGAQPKTRKELYEDPGFLRVFEAEDAIVDEWTETAKANDIRAKEVITAALKEAGYDGVILREDVGSWGRKTEAYIALDPTQVKSATDNVGTFDQNNPDIRYSARTTVPSLRKTLQMMQPTEDMTAAEKELLGKYQGWLAEYEQKQQEVDEQTKIISQTEAKSAEQRAARNRMQVLKSQQRRVLEKIRKAESAEGFARMLNTGRQLARSLGGTSNLAEAQAQTETQLKAISEELGELRKQIGQVNDAEAQRTLEALFDTGKLNEAAKRLKDTFHSKMTLKELRNRIVVINTTMMSQTATAGADAMRLVNDLTKDLLGTGMFDMNDTLGLLKEQIGTISLTERQKQELKHAGITMAEFRRVVNPVVRVAKSGGGDLMSYIEGDDYFGAGMGTGLKALFDGTEGEGDSILRLYEIIKGIREAEDPLANGEYAMMEDPMQAAMMDVMSIVTEATLLDAGTDTVTAMLKAVEKNVDKGSELETKVHDLQKKLTEAKRNAPKAAKLSAVQSSVAWLGSYYEKIERARALAEAKESIEHTKRLLELENAFAMGAWYEAKENAEKRRKLMESIRRQVKWMDTRIRKETDQKRVPENFKPVVEEMIRVLASANDTLRVFKDTEAASILAVYQRLANWDGKNLHRADEQLKEARMMDDLIVEDAEEQLEALKAKIFLYGGMSEIEDAKTRLKASIEVLEDINDLVASVWHAITGIDNVFIAGQRKNIEEVGDELAKELNDKEDYKRKDNWLGKKKEQLDNKLVVGNMTPVYFFKQLGSNVLTRLNNSLLQAQNEYKFMQEDAIKKMAEIKKKRNYYAWKDTAPLTFTTVQGQRLKNGQHTLTLTVDQALSIWAIWRREQYSSPLLTSNHLEKGGMMLKGGEVTEDGYRKEGKLPHKITAADVATIDNYLTEEMKAYATDLIKYMSTDLAAIGNETSMELFGIRKFKEANYFPMKVERDQIEQSSDAGNREQKGNRAAGMSSAKRRVDQATKALVIGSFTDTVGEHINDMLIYSTFAIPIESFNKVLNYAPMDDELRKKFEAGTLEEEDMDMGSRMLIRGMIQQKYGNNMAQYLKKYLADVNGGPMQDFVEKNFFVKALSKFKKVSVMGRLSVVVQQYWALIRARYVMDNKYFMPGAGIGDKLKAADEWAQLRKYSGVARIKESGGFDMTGKGSAISEIVGSYSDQLYTVWDKAKAMVTIGVPKGMKMETAGKVWNDFLGWGAAKMDQLAWIRLWRAVKAETKDLYKDMDVKSDVFLKTAAKRFEEVVNLTQVYDSTLVRSQNMRSKSELMRMATSFMGEPTLTANMLIDALKTKSPKLIAKAACIYYANVIVTAAVKALVSAMGKRDDDDDKPWLEKYLKALGGDLTGWSGELNPLGLFPGMSELMSLMDGYDAERSDLAAAADLVDKVQKLGEGYYDDKPWTYMLEDIATAVADVTGIPLKGLLSSGRTAVNYIRQAASGGDNRSTNARVVWKEFAENVTGGVLGGYVQNILPFMDTSYDKYYTDLYKAQLAGDTEKVAKLEEFLGIQGKSEQAIRTGVKKVIKDQYAAGTLSGEDMQNLLVKLGYEDDLDDAYWTQQEWDYANETGSADGYAKYGDFLAAVETGKNLKATINEYLSHGVDKSTLASQITSAYKAQYVALMKAGKKTEAANLQARILTAYEALGYDRQKKLKDIQKWLDE